MYQSADAGITSLLAPAKINLYLHVTGRLDNRYHTLDSLIGFADIGDTVTIKPAQNFTFTTSGPFSKGFSTKELDSSPSSSNLAVRATWLISHALNKTPDFEIHLTKNLPMGAGIGGGSSDAATILWALMDYWKKSPDEEVLNTIMLELGADVPACLDCRPKFISGIGDVIEPAHDLPEYPIVLVFPGKQCATHKIFQNFHATYKEAITNSDKMRIADNALTFIKAQNNQLTSAAIEEVPEIQNVLNALDKSQNCLLSRMSGSGSTCFGLYNDMNEAQEAAHNISKENPDWWVKTATLNRPERY